VLDYIFCNLYTYITSIVIIFKVQECNRFFELRAIVLLGQLEGYTSKGGCKFKHMSVDMLEIQDAFGSVRSAF
jgi:hypothetical protein